MSFWEDNRFLVTGGAGFLGTHLVENMRRRGARDIFIPRSREYDLVNADAIRQVLEDSRPDIIVHLAAAVGGIGANQKTPGRYFYDNLMMGVQLMEAARHAGIRKF